MTDNPHRIVIELYPSDGFHTTSHAHLAQIVHRRLIRIISEHGVGIEDMIKSVRIEAVPVHRDITVVADEDILHAAMSDLYNSGHYELIAEDGTPVTLVDGRTPCDECGERIPDGDGSIANEHHAESCSLYAPGKD